jgi:hypothetical protein
MCPIQRDKSVACHNKTMPKPDAEDKKIRRRRIADKVSLLAFFSGMVLILSLIVTSLIFSYVPYPYSGLILLIAILFAIIGIISKGIGRFAWPKAETFNTLGKPFLLKALALFVALFILLTMGLSYISYIESQHGYYGPLSPCSLGGCAAKPVIYLYPENVLKVNVSVHLPNGFLTATNPIISADNTWTVTVEPGSRIYQNDTRCPYLFYEGQEPWTLTLNKGWVVPNSNITNWFNATLPKMGLDTNETHDFVSYWAKVTGPRISPTRAITS